jgi:DNA polymerase/3'-5' exonuclease PolX
MAETNKRDLIVRNFEYLANMYREKEPFKSRAYVKAIKMLPAEIYSQADVESIGGKGIQEKIAKMILSNENLPMYDETHHTNMEFESEQINQLSKVHGIGRVKATELVQQHSISSVEQLRTHTHLLNEIQKKGLKYHADIQKRIPRREMCKHNEFLKKVLTVDFVIAGSFRRTNDTSGDIDVLISGEENTLKNVVDSLCKSGYILKDGIFALGEVKLMAMCRLPRYKYARRIDILYSPKNEYAFAQLYFTGNDVFNIEMRTFAANKGFILNEKGLVDKNTGVNVLQNFECEHDIFQFLGYEYVEPSLRNL